MPHVPRPHDHRGATDRAVIALAARQHGCVSARQLAHLGVSATAVGRYVCNGWLVREHRGAYRLAGSAGSGLGRCAAALLAVDGDAAVSARSALERIGVLEEDRSRPVHLTTEAHRRGRPGIVVHQAALPSRDVRRIEGLRVTTLTRSLVDAARFESAAVLTAAVREAEYLRCLDAPALHRAAAGRFGGRLLQRLATERLPVRGELRKGLEREFARFLLERDFPVARVNERLRLRDPDEIVVPDAVFWEAGLAVELDGRQAHATTAAFDADRLRDRRLAVQYGLHVVRVTARHLRRDPDALEADLKTLYARGVARRAVS